MKGQNYKHSPSWQADPSGRTVWDVGLDRLDAETVSSNPA
jgi:hypothetical protein